MVINIAVRTINNSTAMRVTVTMLMLITIFYFNSMFRIGF